MVFLRRPWKDVLGMNARTLEYTAKINSSQALRLAKNKLATKRILQKAGLNTPRLYSVIRNRTELQRFRWTKLPASFVLKPNSSFGGGGIIVIFGRNKKGNWVKADKTEIFIPELRRHILNTLDGNFSNGNSPDIAFFEQRVKVHSTLKPYSIRGVPDIRVLLYNQVPVMAMLRLTTMQSQGRANLHAGGIGIGIDLSLGLTTTAVHYNHLIEVMPGNRLSLSGINIPLWDDVLLLAARASAVANLNFAGVDIAIDRDEGPLVLEINGRPGLGIQFANLAPLRSRLKRVEGLKMKSLGKKISLAKSLFGADVEQEIEDVSGRQIIALEEPVTIINSEGEEHTIKAKIDTGAYRTAIDYNLATKLKLHEPVIQYKDVRGTLGIATRPVVQMTMRLRGRTRTTDVFLADRSLMKYDIILGRRDVKGFLIDPNKKA